VDSGIGSEKAAAPQARLMATVINGILSRKLPWAGDDWRLSGCCCRAARGSSLSFAVARISQSAQRSRFFAAERCAGLWIKP